MAAVDQNVFEQIGLSLDEEFADSDEALQTTSM
jgi:hypothetical protein